MGKNWINPSVIWILVLLLQLLIEKDRGMGPTTS